VWQDMVRYTLEQRVFLYDTCVKYGSAGKCRRKFRDESVPSRQTIHNFVNKLRTMGLLKTRKQNISVECLLRRNDLCDFFSSGVV
jgi:hypothetical protein